MDSTASQIAGILSQRMQIDQTDRSWRVTGPKVVSETSEIYRGISPDYPSHVAIKRLELEELADQFDGLRYARDLLSPEPLFDAPKPIDMLEIGSKGLLVMEWIEGPSVETLLTHRYPGTANIHEAIARSGKLLACLHKEQRLKSKAIDPEGFLDDIHDAFSGPIKMEDSIGQAVDYLTCEASRAFEHDLYVTYIHGDFKPSNVLLSETMSYCIDGSFKGEGATIHDLAHYANHLLMALYHPRAFPRLRERTRLLEIFLSSWEAGRGSIPGPAFNWLRLQKLVMIYASVLNRKQRSLRHRYLLACLRQEIKRSLEGVAAI